MDTFEHTPFMLSLSDKEFHALAVRFLPDESQETLTAFTRRMVKQVKSRYSITDFTGFTFTLLGMRL